MFSSSDLLVTAAFTNAPTATVVCDPSGRILFANRAVERLFGYQPGNLAGQPVELLVPYAVNDVGPARCVDGHHENGSRIPVEVEWAVAASENGPLMVASIVDVTPRRQLEERLARVE